MSRRARATWSSKAGTGPIADFACTTSTRYLCAPGISGPEMRGNKTSDMAIGAAASAYPSGAPTTTMEQAPPYDSK